MRFLSVCSGIEAASVAWHPLGWTCAGVAEIEPFPRAVLQERLGVVPVDYDTHKWAAQQNFTPLFGDFTKIEDYHVGPVDLLVGGTPCQSFSIAGKRLGLDDPRGNLTLEFLALAKRVRPRWIVWENVPGILSHEKGRTFGTFLGLMAECGFERWAYRVLDAQYVRVGRFGRAVPQRRRRVFLVGYSGTSAIHPRTVLFDRESLRGDSAPRRESGQGTSHDIAPSLVSSGRGVERTGETRGQDPVIAQQVAPTLNAAFGTKLGLEDQHIRGGGACSSLPDVSMCLNAGAMGRCDAETETLIPTQRCDFDVAPIAFAQNTRDEVRLFGDDGQTVGALAAEPGMKQQCYVALPPVGSLDTQTDPNGRVIAFDMRGREGGAMPEGPHDTANIRAANGGSSRSYVATEETYAIQERAVSENIDNGPQGKGYQEGVAYTLEARNKVQSVAASWRVRRLTPRECERLQAFPDDWTRIPWRGKTAEQCPDGPRYKACGNSMAVNVMAWIGERIAAVDAIARQGEAA